MILLIDNYDSFTYNLYQQLGGYIPSIEVRRNDRINLDEISLMQPEALVLSPGPGRPEEAGVCMEAVQQFSGTIPMLGICLGHQVIASAFGGSVIAAKRIMHGKRSIISHTERGIFSGLPEALEVMRYHSLAVSSEHLPECLQVDAIAGDGELMALSHRNHATYGLQFHPESIGTSEGDACIRNFLEAAKIGRSIPS
ncbi:anthranilate synthase component II [Bacillus sp. 1P06AnD]|uniref:anthranilate synthase component II n=1 Tax=Bacillus sp. 1P06AnD TaxID=3132208 RepID=UPI0039A0FC69